MGTNKDHPMGSIENDIAQARALGVDLIAYIACRANAAGVQTEGTATTLPTTQLSRSIAIKDYNRKKKKKRRRK